MNLGRFAKIVRSSTVIIADSSSDEEPIMLDRTFFENHPTGEWWTAAEDFKEFVEHVFYYLSAPANLGGTMFVKGYSTEILKMVLEKHLGLADFLFGATIHVSLDGSLVAKMFVTYKTNGYDAGVVAIKDCIFTEVGEWANEKDPELKTKIRSDLRAYLKQHTPVMVMAQMKVGGVVGQVNEPEEPMPLSPSLLKTMKFGAVYGGGKTKLSEHLLKELEESKNKQVVFLDIEASYDTKWLTLAGATEQMGMAMEPLANSMAEATKKIAEAFKMEPSLVHGSISSAVKHGGPNFQSIPKKYGKSYFEDCIAFDSLAATDKIAQTADIVLGLDKAKEPAITAIQVVKTKGKSKEISTLSFLPGEEHAWGQPEIKAHPHLKDPSFPKLKVDKT